MTKANLITAVAEAANMTKKDTAAFIDAFVVTVGNALANGEEVALSGFGIFKPKQMAERIARNPATGETVTVPAHNKVTFKPSQVLKDAVR